MKLRSLVPLLLFLGLAAMLAVGLGLDQRELPSPLVRRPAPPFTLARLDAPGSQFGPDDMRGQVWLLNVWASWCVACRVEHSVLLRAARDGNLALLECLAAATGEHRYVLCAVGRADDGDYVMTPFGHLADGNPYDAYLPPDPNDPNGFVARSEGGAAS